MNPIVHFEIHAADADKIQKFYQDVFGWRITTTGPEFGGYRMIATGGNELLKQATKGINGGIAPRKGPLPAGGDPVNAFVCIVGVDDIDASIEKARAAGGTEALAKMDVPNVGLLAYYKDPEGNLFGMVQPAPMMGH